MVICRIYYKIKTDLFGSRRPHEIRGARGPRFKSLTRSWGDMVEVWLVLHPHSKKLVGVCRLYPSQKHVCQINNVNKVLKRKDYIKRLLQPRHLI